MSHSQPSGLTPSRFLDQLQPQSPGPPRLRAASTQHSWRSRRGFQYNPQFGRVAANRPHQNSSPGPIHIRPSAPHSDHSNSPKRHFDRLLPPPLGARPPRSSSPGPILPGGPPGDSSPKKFPCLPLSLPSAPGAITGVRAPRISAPGAIWAATAGGAGPAGPLTPKWSNRAHDPPATGGNGSPARFRMCGARPSRVSDADGRQLGQPSSRSFAAVPMASQHRRQAADPRSLCS
eukprot:1179089-Prorocentrum_minimum.AAC.2